MLSTLLWILVVVLIVVLILNLLGVGGWTTNNGVSVGTIIAIVLLIALLLFVL